MRTQNSAFKLSTSNSNAIPITIVFGFTITLFITALIPANSIAQKPIPGSNYEAERLLHERGYWITRIDEISDSSTFHAVVAFQKVEGRRKNGKLSGPLIKAIRNASRPKPFYIGAAHVEIDLSRQVLFLVDDKNTVTHILPVSTGSGKAYYHDGIKHLAYTPIGVFKITRQIKGIRRAPLGILYHPNYFYNGVAIHGSNSIPFYPASHGCVRIPRFAAKGLSELLRIDMPVAIYRKPLKKQRRLIESIKTAKRESSSIPNIPCADSGKLKTFRAGV